MTIFLEKSLSQIPRIVGFLDVNPRSRTYGCFDRTYWHYKTIDFSNARFQEATLAIALVYSIKSPTNRFFHSKTALEWINAAIDFWAQHRHRDGSVDESYPFEHHFCATAFSLYAVTETLLLLPRKCFVEFKQTGNFLLRHNNLAVANQMACAAAALHNLYLLTGTDTYKRGSEQKLRQLLDMQDGKGFFAEYGGFDLGYDSITLSFLADLYKKTGREDIKEAALRCLQQMIPYITDNGYYDPAQMSRKTQFIFPYGMFVFGSGLLDKIVCGLKQDVILNPAWMDDRYCIPLTINYLQTAREYLST